MDNCALSRAKWKGIHYWAFHMKTLTKIFALLKRFSTVLSVHFPEAIRFINLHRTYGHCSQSFFEIFDRKKKMKQISLFKTNNKNERTTVSKSEKKWNRGERKQTLWVKKKRHKMLDKTQRVPVTGRTKQMNGNSFLFGIFLYSESSFIWY